MTGKLVEFQHGAATVSGERVYNDATVERISMGRRRGAKIRESGDSTTGSFQYTLRAKGRWIVRQFSFYHFSYSCTCVRACKAVLFLSLTLGFNPSVVFSEDEKSQEEENVQTLEPVVVSATKTPVPISHLTSAVEVITGEQIQKRKIKTVTEALRLSQGLVILESGGPGSNATARIRGAANDQTLVLIDGAIVNSGTLGSYNFANLMVNNIEKIEILRGAQGMLWGADAMGGVINITTKRGIGAPRASTFFEYGSFESLREGGSVSGRTGPVAFSMSLLRWDIAKFSAINFRRGAVESDAYRNWQASSRVGVALPKDGRVEFNFRWLNGDTDIDNATTFGGGPFDVFKSQSTSRQFIYTGVYQQPITDWWSQKLTLGRAQEDLETQAGTLQRSVVSGATGPSFNTTSNIKTLNDRLEWQHNFQILKPLALNVGYQFREQQGENISATGFPTKTISNNAGFAQAQLNLWDRLFATAGLRQDSFNTVGDATTYRVTGGYLHKETGTKIRGSYATGFRAPTINQLFFPNFGNPNLGPEKSQSLDVGLEQHLFQKQLFVSVGYFWNRFRDLILSVFDPVGCGGLSQFGFCAQNVGSARSQGWETNLKYSLPSTLPFLKLIELQAQYTYTFTQDLDTGAQLPRWPIHLASALLTYQPIDPLVVSLAFRYVGSRFNTTGNQQPLKAFDVFNLAMTYNVNENLQAYTRIDNLFNEKYEEVLFFGTPVRSIFGGIRMSFDVPLLSSKPNGQS